LAGVAIAGIADTTSVDGNLRWKGIQRLDWHWNGVDLVGTARFLDGYHELLPNGHNHWVSQTWAFDGQLSYDFTFVPPVENQAVAEYSKNAADVTTSPEGKTTESSTSQTASYAMPVWQRVLNNTTIT